MTPTSLVPSGGTNDPVVPPRESTIADRVSIVADALADPDILNRFQLDPKGAARDIHGDEASPVLVAKTADLLLQGHPAIKSLLSGPTPRRKEAAMILLEGVLLHDDNMACAEAALSVPGIQDFIAADPSNASLLFLGTDPPSSLVEEVSDKYMSNDAFQALLHLSTSSAASLLCKFIATHTTEAKPAASAGSNVPGAGNEEDDPVVARVYGKVLSISKSDEDDAIVVKVDDKVYVLSDMADPNGRRDVAKAPACNVPNDCKVSATEVLAPQDGGLLHENGLVPAVPQVQQRNDSAVPLELRPRALSVLRDLSSTQGGDIYQPLLALCENRGGGE